MANCQSIVTTKLTYNVTPPTLNDTHSCKCLLFKNVTTVGKSSERRLPLGRLDNILVSAVMFSAVFLPSSREGNVVFLQKYRPDLQAFLALGSKRNNILFTKIWNRCWTAEDRTRGNGLFSVIIS